MTQISLPKLECNTDTALSQGIYESPNDDKVIRRIKADPKPDKSVLMAFYRAVPVVCTFIWLVISRYCRCIITLGYF